MAKVTNVARVGTRLAICDCDTINARLDYLEGTQCDCGAIEQRLIELETTVAEIWQEIRNIERFVFLSDVRTFPTSNSLLSDISVSVINVGHTFNFWGSGSIVGSPSLTNNTVYYIINQSVATSMIPELTWYQGDSTIGTLWIEIPGVTAVYNFPLRFDATGIYFRTTQAVNNIIPGTLFKFTQALILVDTTA